MNAPFDRPAASSSGTPLALLLGPAGETLDAVLRGRSLDAALAEVEPALRPGVQDLAYRSLRGLGRARAWRAHLVAREPRGPIAALLLVALALLEPDEGGTLPYAAHVVVDQAVRAARPSAPGARRGQAGQSGAAGFVNAVLRERLRQEGRWAPAPNDVEASTNLPAWWWKRLVSDWGADRAASIAAAGLRRPPMVLRVNRRRATLAQVRARLADAGVDARTIGETALHLPVPHPVNRLPGFAEGWWSVQDLSAQQAAPRLVDPAGLAPLPDGARVLDACAAPGGKTAHLLELRALDLVAIDRDPVRLQRVRETLARLGLEASVLEADAADPAAWWDGRLFDAILLDAPCSGSGVVRRHPDIPWLRRPGDVAALLREQDRLLDGLWPTLARGGRLLFATCSVFADEGSRRIDSFLQRHDDARPAPSPASAEHLLPVLDNESGTEPGGDGFFYALIEKT